MQSLPLESAGPEFAAAVSVPLEAMLSQIMAVDMASNVAVSQLARLLETLGRSALVRPEAATALLQRLFTILGTLPTDDPTAPPVRARAALVVGPMMIYCHSGTASLSFHPSPPSDLDAGDENF
jgi:exportin-5